MHTESNTSKHGFISWKGITALIFQWIVFFAFTNFGLFWFPHEGFALKGYVINQDILIETLTILMVAKTVNSVSQIVFWDYLLPRIIRRPVPFLLIQCVSLLVYVIAMLVITGTVFGKSVVGFLATLGGMGIIIGLAIQRFVMDAFAGILFNLDNSYSLGDFIKINTGKENVMGRVTNISWRITTITTTDDSEIHVPNHLLSTSIVLNFSRPSTVSRFDQSFYFESSEDHTLVLEILTNALLSVSALGHIEKDHPFKVRLSKCSHNEGAVYKMKFFLNPVKNGPGKVKNLINTAVFKHAKAVGLHFYDSNKRILKTDTNDSDYNAGDKQKMLKVQLLKNVTVFDNLTSKEFDHLIANMTRHVLKPNFKIVSQGDLGESIFIVEKGFAKVHVKTSKVVEATDDIVTDILNPGDFFGEMSALTGEPTEATVISETEMVIYEISKEIIVQL